MAAKGTAGTAAVAARRDAEAGEGAAGAAAVAATMQELAAVVVAQPFKLNNIALKWIRDSHEEPPGWPTTDRVDLTNRDPLEIGILDRTTGPGYGFKADEKQPWSWRQMVAAMAPEVKTQILGAGDDAGVVSMSCEPIAGSYDHKRWHASRTLGRPFDPEAPVPLWDFVVRRTDGNVVRFHTSLKGNKVEIAYGVLALPNAAPCKGKGKSEGRGTYKRKTAANYEQALRSSQDTSGSGATATNTHGGEAAEGGTHGGGAAEGGAHKGGVGDAEHARVRNAPSAVAEASSARGSNEPLAQEPPPGLSDRPWEEQAELEDGDQKSWQDWGAEWEGWQDWGEGGRWSDAPWWKWKKW